MDFGSVVFRATVPMGGRSSTHFTGVFFASATSDDVQGLAMLACEGIGAALSITAETPTKVGKLCTRDHQVS